MGAESTLHRLLTRLSDGNWHSGQDLGNELSISRAAVAKQIKHVSELGLELEAVKGVGYRAEPYELLGRDEIRLASGVGAHFDAGLSVFHSLPSTNQYLIDALREGKNIHGLVCLAETQTQGRGRRGRQWVSPFAKNLYLSFGWSFAGGVSQIEGLSLAVGAVICRVLDELGFEHASLKWPNDILVGDKKLGGVLIELGGDAVSNCVVVVGVGLNVDMMPGVNESIDQPWTSLRREGAKIGRNVLAGKLSSALLGLLHTYAEQGFSSYREEWNENAAFVGDAVTVSSASEQTEGEMLGVGGQGELLLKVGGEKHAFYGGELSLRKVK